MLSLAAATAMGAGANVLGGLMGAGSARSINQQSIALAREQMRFQERMSSTAYQRSAKDLEAAGLNRILALGGPSSSPSGAQPPQLKNPGEQLQKGITSAVQNAAVAAQIKKLIQDTRVTGLNADILEPKAALARGVSSTIKNVTPTIKKVGGDLKDWIQTETGTAPTTARDPQQAPIALNTDQYDNVGRKVIGLTLVERVFKPSNTIAQNVAAYHAAYLKREGIRPTAKQLRTAGRKLSAMMKAQR